jgi:hypothetical protein
MRKSTKMKVGAVGISFALAGTLAVVASGTTGAYFSAAQGGTISGAIGTVALSTTNTTFAWTNMMPGEPRTVTVNFTNTGTGPQDFYLAFPDDPALHALNNLGSFGEVHVLSGGTDVFDSTNLNDGRHDTSTTAPGSNSCGSIFSATGTGCWPLPTNLKLAGSLAANATSSFTFSFNYAGKLGKGSGGGGVFNSYPLTALTDANVAADTAGPAGAGLPFQVVAVQVGQTP